jgi:predicted metal-dependent HD superfamily phosphohydrolase
MLQRTFVEACSAYSRDNALIESLWQQVYQAYSAADRHYHGIFHLEAMLLHLERVKSHIADWDVVILALFYHDFVYHPLKSDNEEKSAVKAGESLRRLAFPEIKAQKVQEIILATKGHSDAKDIDINSFLDADLSILGSGNLNYDRYKKAVRQEYHLVPDFVYNPGRRKVIQKFLDQPSIFKTPAFSHLEMQARSNLLAELSELQK